MTDREINIKSVLFLVVGILLLLSLIICIYIVNGERDLIEVEADVIEVEPDKDGTGKNDVTVVYNVDGTSYEYNFYYKDDVNVDDKLTIFYHEENATSVQMSKTSKIIFICPIIGLGLCSYGLYELFKKNNKFKKIKLIKNNNVVPIEMNSPREEVEEVEETPINEDVEPIPEISDETVEVNIENVANEISKAEVEDEVNESEETIMQNELPMIKSDVEQDSSQEITSESSYVQDNEDNVEETADSNKIEEVATDRVQEQVNQVSPGLNSAEEMREVIKEVLKEVIKEVNEEKEPPKKVEQQRIIPNYFYISGTSLIYEEPGKKAKEINLKDIKRVVRTINSAGNVVKLVVSSDEVKCVLTNMKNIDLEQLANLLHNKMRTIDDTFKEIIERKEY